MKRETKTILIGSLITLVVLALIIFLLYKRMDLPKKEEAQVLSPSKVNTPVVKEEEQNTNTNASENKESIETNKKEIIYLFHGSRCPHCKTAIADMKKKKETTYKEIEIRTYEVWDNKENNILLQKIANNLGIEINGVPFFIIGSYSMVGYNEENLLSEFKKAQNNENYKDIVEETIKENPDLNTSYEIVKMN